MFNNTQCPLAEAEVLVERRSGADRRQRRFNVLRAYSNGRRRHLRRQSDRRRIDLLDYYSPIIFYLVVLILMLSVVDALLTLWLLDLGAKELNPVMAYFLEFGPTTFMIAKYLITAFSVVVITLLNYVCIQRIRFAIGNLLVLFAGCFGAVVLWELALFMFYIP